MSKRSYNIYIEDNIIKLLRLKQLKEQEFIPSKFIEDLLREYLQDELNETDIEEYEIKEKVKTLERDLALMKIKGKEIERLKEDKRNQKDKERGFGKRVPVAWDV